MIYLRVLHIGFTISDYVIWVHSSAWIEWLPAEQLVEGPNPSGPGLFLIRFQ